MDGARILQHHIAAEPRVETDPAKWYVAVVMTGLERIVRQRLNELADRENCRIETFLPLVETQAFTPAKPATRKRPATPALPQICVPMFRGYLFLQLDIADPTISWDRVREIRGFGRLLTNEHGRPVPVRGLAKVIDEADKDGLVPPDALERLTGKARPGKHLFAEGDMVRIQHGNFASYNGVFLECRREKARVMIGDLKVDVLLDHLELVA